ncbi:enoyl-CoA hydratase/isomerase family protein [Lacibacter sediminis]|uniref:Enoyl-CoA hydratase/isomerase family protein n=1 Tax=Lacibacter sediminis TaxID=2760713 RepID=A0A7G5XI33_9BACT|nr:enoyl-CoA hydratase-related protein [Lacibacter sediminis]QNA45136.1 enoyl-CoA hydratase/isomerase family protein [Lacibacter sediminis]
MGYQTLLTSLEDGVFIITINRPDKLNALNKTVIEELSAAVDEVYNNNEIKSAIITGSGPKAFVAGADISEFLSMDATDGEALARKGQEMVFNKIERSSKPIVAAINGFALGGGCELAMSCHFRLASENAKFGQPEVNLGLIPGYGGTQRLVQLIGKGKAIELMMTAAMIDANEAKQFGLVNYVTTAEELLPKTKELLGVIMTKGPNAVGKIIKAVNAHFDNTQNGFDAEIKLFGECFGTDEMKEGVTAFLEKRKADFPR